MALFDLLKHEAAASRRDIAIAIVVSGVANTIILAVINSAAQTVSYQTLNVRLLAIFVVAMALHVTGFLYTFDAATQIFEQMLAKVRTRMVEKIANSELLVLDQIGKARIFQSITQDTSLISESQGLLVAACQSAVMIFFTSIYVMTISLPAFLIILGGILAGVVIYMSRQQEVTGLMQASAAAEARFIGMTSDLIDGLKEIKLSRRRGADMLRDLEYVAVSLRDLKIRTMNLYNRNAVFSQGFYYTLLGIIVFLLPRLLEGFATEVPRLVATILFVIGPLATIVTALPTFTKANQAATSLLQLEAEISSITSVSGVSAAPEALPFERMIGCDGLRFHYPRDDPAAFQVGPIDLVINRGEITMFVGGNGSGKTTFLKLLAGLYAPSAGNLSLDGQAVTPGRLQDYRELFGAIYNDFHLFPKLYGIAAEADAIDAQIERLGLANKIGYGPDGFSTLGLSTGQRKRVAMLVTLLEDRPILIFDEWAAEQDPDFRRYFYEVLLPELKARGKTLLVATHDDRYFHVADTLVTMELGRVRSIERPNVSPPPRPTRGRSPRRKAAP
jgi:putative ATP-binding cassette transporter